MEGLPSGDHWAFEDGRIAATGASSSAVGVNDAELSIFVKDPTISKIKPSSVAIGSRNIEVQIDGQYFESGATVSIADHGVTVSKVVFVSVTKIKFTVTVTKKAGVGSESLTVTEPDGGTTTCDDCITVSG